MKTTVAFAVCALLAPCALAQAPSSKVLPQDPKPVVRQNKDAKQDPKQDPKKVEKPVKVEAVPGKTETPPPAEVTDTKVVAEEKAAGQLPAGNDPADIAAMASAKAMLAAEKRLKQMLKEGKFKDVDRILTFEEISSWPYEDGLTGMPAPVRKLDGEKVLMTGFMLPIDEVEGIKEFLLVQSLWSCCYGQPPDINGIVRVVMKGKSRVDYQFDPVKIVGDFKVEAAFEDGYCLDVFQLHADSVEVIK